jgi:RNA polymerase sigma-70 factor (ECF subfamily)
MSLSLANAPLLSLSPRAESELERALLGELVSRLRSRDDVLIDRVLRELVPRVRQWMLRHLGPRPEVDDATQEALSEIAGALHRFEGRSSLMTLAHRIVVRTSYRYYRGGAAALGHADEAVGAAGPDLQGQVIARRALVRLQAALAQLPPRRRTAFVLCAIEGMEPSEAAEVLEVSANAMRSLLCRAREELEAVLASDDELGRKR